MPIKVDEVSQPEAYGWMRIISKSLEQHYGVKIEDEAVKLAVQHSSQFIPKRQLPEKVHPEKFRDMSGYRYRSPLGKSTADNDIQSAIDVLLLDYPMQVEQNCNGCVQVFQTKNKRMS